MKAETNLKPTYSMCHFTMTLSWSNQVNYHNCYKRITLIYTSTVTKLNYKKDHKNKRYDPYLLTKILETYCNFLMSQFQTFCFHCNKIFWSSWWPFNRVTINNIFSWFLRSVIKRTARWVKMTLILASVPQSTQIIQ